jgi:hypothetical protein
MAKLAKGVLVLGFASATLATPESSCKSPAAPTSATYATRLSQFNRKSGVTDFAVRFDKVESASGTCVYIYLLSPAVFLQADILTRQLNMLEHRVPTLLGHPGQREIRLQHVEDLGDLHRSRRG